MEYKVDIVDEKKKKKTFTKYNINIRPKGKN